jgi:bis(5'-adenosyl)-triphosphatase
VRPCPFDGDNIRPAEYFGTDRFAALYNIAPIVPGHSLLIPRRHVARLLELTDDEVQEFFLLARGITRFLVAQFTAAGFDWSIQDGQAAGQTVPHVHLHIIPRWPHDLPSPGGWYDRLKLPVSASADEVIDSALRPRLSPAELSRVVNRLAAEASTAFRLEH